ncbi:MAG: hypothetical protein Q7T82_17815 [Armatimonadota bacterium]|nr:hypothetical protein [Armatimonadota bacterium]
MHHRPSRASKTEQSIDECFVLEAEVAESLALLIVGQVEIVDDFVDVFEDDGLTVGADDAVGVGCGDGETAAGYGCRGGEKKMSKKSSGSHRLAKHGDKQIGMDGSQRVSVEQGETGRGAAGSRYAFRP